MCHSALKPSRLFSLIWVCLLLLSITGPAVAQDQPKSLPGVHLFILSGQSNMAGMRPAESFTPAVEKAFGKEKVLIVFDAQGGQPIRRWDKGWKKEGSDAAPKTGDLYDRLMKKVRAAVKEKKIASVTFVWMQGERDAREQNAKVYAASLDRVRQQIKKDLKRDSIHLVIGRLSDFDMDNRRYKHWTQIRDVQVQYAKENRNTEWVNTDDLNDGKNRRGKDIKNDLHYSGEGYKILGDRFAAKAIELIKAKK